jgi:hypothetical protein
LTPAQILARIIGPDHTLADVKAAFTGQHPEIPAYDWVADVKMRGERVAIDGIIRENGAEIGHFTRQLYYAKGIGTAFHTIMEIEKDKDKDKDIGRYHYRRAIAFYESAGIREIDMEAEGEGPVVWATFGFDFTRSQHREMLMKILREWEITPLPDQAGLLAPSVVAISTEDNEELGEDVIYELLDRAGEPLPMSLDLRNEAQRVYLRERRIL